MILKGDQILFLTRNYRKQYLYPYLKKYKKASINNIFYISKTIVITDFPPKNLLRILSFFNKKIYVFLWNNLDELIRYIDKNPDYISIINKNKISFLFPFEIDDVLLKQIRKTDLNFKYEVFLPKYIIKKVSNKLGVEKKIIFFGEIDVLTKKDKLYNEVKNYSYEILNGSKSYNQIEEYVLNNFGDLNYYENVLKIRNFIRYLYLQEVSNLYKKNLILVGSTLSKIKGATYFSSNYSYDFRINFLKKFENSVFIDLLGKSSSSCLYPRSQELLEHVNYIFQLKTFNSSEIINLNNRVSIFNSIDDLVYKLNYHFINST